MTPLPGNTGMQYFAEHMARSHAPGTCDDDSDDPPVTRDSESAGPGPGSGPWLASGGPETYGYVIFWSSQHWRYTVT
jgi:hypothetical protein